MTIRVFLLDDHEVVRRGVRELLESEGDVEVAGEAGTAEEALGRIPATTPDVAVLDVRLPDGDGVEVCREIRSAHPEIACVMLTSFSDDEALFDAVMAGAAGYLLKDIDAHELARAVHLAAEGSAVIHPNLTRQFIEEIRQLTRGEQSVSALSGREVEVLQMIAYGSTNREVAEALHISPQTVKTYLERIFTKLGVSDRTRAVAVALKHGIVE